MYIENGRNELDMEIIVKLVNIFGVLMDYLLGRSSNSFIDIIVVYIDLNVIEEDIKEIFVYIEEKRKDYVNEKEINIIEVVLKGDEEVNEFVDENEDFKVVVVCIMSDVEVVKVVKLFIEFYE